MSQRTQAIIGFTISGAVLILLAGPAPKAALGLVGIIGLGVALSHGSEITALLSTFTTAIKPAG